MPTSLLPLIATALAAPSRDGVAWAELAHDLASAEAFEQRAEAAHTLRDAPPDVLADVARHFLRAVAWHPDAVFPFRGATPLFPALRLNEPERLKLLDELIAHRVGLTLRGRHDVPPRLEAELQAALYETIADLGTPRDTVDWLHLYAAAGGDLPGLLERLDLRIEGRFAYVVAVDARIRTHRLRDVMPLLADRSAIVRARAARRIERSPADGARMLRRAWRFAPGRSAPFRGDVAAPALPWDPTAAGDWAHQLVRWTRRAHRQRDDGALRAALHLLCEPGLTSMLEPHHRERIGRLLAALAERSRPGPARDLGQAMDAVLRRVSFADGAHPVPRAQVGG